DDGGNTAQRHQHDRRQVRERDADPGGRERRDVQLSLGADVQQAATERDRDRQAGEDQWRREEQRVADAVRPREGAAEQEAIRLDGTVADERDDHRAGEKRAQDGQRRKEQVAKNLHARPPVISRPISSCVARDGSTSPATRPLCRTSRRSASAVTSSSSADTSSTAQPASRSATIFRWMNSMAPISTPRVGCEISRSTGGSPNSRPMISFCWLPPDSARAGSEAFGGRTSNSRMTTSARRSIACWFSSTAPTWLTAGGR